MTRKGGRISVCTRCQRLKLHEARNLCKSCYNKVREGRARGQTLSDYPLINGGAEILPIDNAPPSPEPPEYDFSRVEIIARALQARYEQRAQTVHLPWYTATSWENIDDVSRQEHRNIVQAVLDGNTHHNDIPIPEWVIRVVDRENTKLHPHDKESA